MFIVVAEKASVAKAIKDALPSSSIRVEWVRGHIMDIDLPTSLRVWRLESIQDIMHVRNFRYIVRDGESYSRLNDVFKKCKADDALVIATDNDHEGELIGYEILMLYRKAKKDGAYYRMRFNSTDRREIVDAWNRLEPSLNWRWVSKAMFRHKFDLLSGASYTRLLTLARKSNNRYSIAYDDNTTSKGSSNLSYNSGSKGNGGKRNNNNYRSLISWGSCQTPTLNFIVERERAIENFRPVNYWYIDALIEYNGMRFKAKSNDMYDEAHAMQVYESCKDSTSARVIEYRDSVVRIYRPLPSRTDDALRDLVRITGKSASYLLDIMEDLYSKGYISYPRTDTNRYPKGFDFAKPFRVAVDGLVDGDTQAIDRHNPRPRNGDLDDGAHPPIYPVSPYRGSGIEREVWEYVARRFLANAFADDAIAVKQYTRLATVKGGVELYADGLYLRDEGFFKIYRYSIPRENRIPQLNVNGIVKIASIDLVKSKTKSPSRLSEAELLELMERHGIGTDATRAEFPSLLLKRGYATKLHKRFRPTALGIAVIDALKDVDPRLVNSDTRMMVERLMKDIEGGKVEEGEALSRSIEVYEHLLAECMKNIDVIAKRLCSV